MNQDKTTSRIEELDKPEIWTPEANWHIPKAKAVFTFPAFGPGNYNAVVEKVLANKQRLPTGEQTAFMLDEAYNSIDVNVRKSHRTENVRGIVSDNWFWVPVVNIWTPNNVKNPGMYSLFDANGEGLAKEVTTEELEDRLSYGFLEKRVRFSKDRMVAFAPKNIFNGGYHEKGTLKNDGVFIAVYGPEGAERLDKVADNFSEKPYSWIVNNTSNKLVKSLSALGRLLYDIRLYAGFYSDGNNRDGYVLSVSGSENSAEGTAPKK